jgi:FAD/FMN-containing dehydrogenase
MHPGEHLEELEELLGPAGVLTVPSDLVRFTEPYRGAPGPAAAVARPRSVDEVRDLVRWARRHRVRLLPQGANSGLVGASTPPAGAGGSGAPVVVSLERTAGDPLIDPIDRTATVTAGTRLSTLNEKAARHGLVLPIDLCADPSIGGMVATNTGGARMLRHGDMRRHVLGVRAVIADDDASVIDELSTLRKHNVGPALTQLLVGSSGALGIITDVVVDLGRLPDSRSCAWVIPTNADSALEMLLHLERRHGEWLEAFEVVSAEALRSAVAHGAPAPFGPEVVPELSVLIEFAGDAPAEDRLVSALGHLASQGLLTEALVVPADTAWATRHAITEGLRGTGTVLGFDVSVPRPALPAFRERVRLAVAAIDPDALVADFGHWGDGGIHCNVVVPGMATITPDRSAALREVVLGTAVDGFGGSFSAEHGVGPGNADWWYRTVPAPVQRTINSLKRTFDPLGVLGHPGLPFG